MGECAYYIKAHFKTEEEAQKAAEELSEFIEEANKAYNFYQNKGSGKDPQDWIDFEKQYPRVAEYAKTLPGWGKDFNEFSGKLDFGQNGNEFIWDGKTIGYGDYDVWHFADWDPWAEYIKTKYKALKVVWDTEENGCGSLNGLLLYDYEGIVNAILTKKKLLPMLMGLHDDLDDILKTEFKKG